jgi:hypothetical protein
MLEGNDNKVTATIEVLMAEVRTLLIGRRQVTLSVYRQLDSVDPYEIEPFGRVSDKQDQDKRLHVVGRHLKDGSLVRSSYYISETQIIDPWVDGHDRVVIGVGAKQENWDTSSGNFPIDGYDVSVHWNDTVYPGELSCHARVEDHYSDHDPILEEVEWTDDNKHMSLCKMWHWRSNFHRAEAFREARADIARYESNLALLREWKELPLIVLAGLR